MARTFDTIADAHDALRVATRELDERGIIGATGPYRSHAETRDAYPYTLPENALTFDTIDAMRRAVDASGSHYFDADSVRFFRSRLDQSGRMWGGRFFVESVKYTGNPYNAEDHDGPRVYRVEYVSEYVNPTTGDRSLSIERAGTTLDLVAARWWAREFARLVGEA